MKLFKKLAAIYSASEFEGPIRHYIRRWLRSVVPDATLEMDLVGNMYITRGQADTYPCVVAHLDQVQQPYPADYQDSWTIRAYSPSLRQSCGLGADDKCGIWIALKMLKKHPVIKIAFFPGEEIGCVGSSKANMDFFSNVRYVIQPDRRGAHDLITNIGFSEICSDDFIRDINPDAFGYKENTGMMTDVETLKQRGLAVSCINLSCGYYSPHTENEYIIKADMINALDFVDSIITNCTDAYPHIAPKPEIISGYGYRGRRAKHRHHQTTAKGDNNWTWWDSLPADRQQTDKSTDKDLENDWSTQAYYEAWQEQAETARDYLYCELVDNPTYTSKDFLDSYGATLDLLNTYDVDAIISEILDNMDEAAEYNTDTDADADTAGTPV